MSEAAGSKEGDGQNWVHKNMMGEDVIVEC